MFSYLSHPLFFCVTVSKLTLPLLFFLWRVNMQLTHCSCVYIANPTENSASFVEILVRLVVYERLAQLIELIGSAIFTKLSQLCESYTQTVLGQSIIADSVDKRLTYQTHIDQTIMKCERLIRILHPLMSRGSYLSIQNKILIYILLCLSYFGELCQCTLFETTKITEQNFKDDF